METIPERGSSRLREAWKNRTLTEESVESIAVALEQSQATIDKVSFTGSTEMVLTFGEAPAATPSANEGPVVDVGALPQVGGLVAGLGG